MLFTVRVCPEYLQFLGLFFKKLRLKSPYKFAKQQEKMRIHCKTAVDHMSEDIQEHPLLLGAPLCGVKEKE